MLLLLKKAVPVGVPDLRDPSHLLSGEELIALFQADPTGLIGEATYNTPCGPVLVCHDFNIPDTGGISQDARCVYFDKRLPQLLKVGGAEVDVWQFLVIHERVEKHFMDHGLPYEQAHDIATCYEHAAVMAAGLDPRAYERALKPYIRLTEKEAGYGLPHDLELKPYAHRHLADRVRKSMQMGLFEAPVQVEGHVRGGKFIAPYQSKRKKAPEQHHPAPLPAPVEHETSPQPEKEGVKPRLQPEKPEKGAPIPAKEPITPLETQQSVKAAAPAPSELEARADDPATNNSFGVPEDATPVQRRAWNAEALALLQTRGEDTLTPEHKAVLRRYSGRGGIGDSLNEYYTRADVATAIWAALARLGFSNGGEVLEPSAGTGVFLHTAPGGVKVAATELDATSSTIARLLHPQHEVHQSTLEDFAGQDPRLFDAVVGNPPFGLRGSFIADDKPDIPKAEQYFLDTALDKTKAGGLVALVLPTGVLDASSASAFRQRLLCKGAFLGALRMPNTAFKHADTEVTTDVVFFRRRSPDVAQALLTLPDDKLDKLGVLDKEFIRGDYFEGRGAGNILGQMEAGWRAKAGMGDDITVTGSMDGVSAAIAAFEPEQTLELDLPAVLAALTDAEAAKAKRAALKAPYEVAVRGDTKVVDGVTYVLTGEPPRWHRTDEADGEPAHVLSARQLGESIGAFAQGQGGASAIVQNLEAWIAANGPPRSNPDILSRAAGDKDLHRFMSAVQPDGSFSDLLTGKRQGGEASVEAAADRLSLQGTFTGEQLRQTTGGDDIAAIEDMLIASDRYAMTGLGTESVNWQSMDQYLTGELWPKLDAVQEMLKSDMDAATRAKLDMQAQRLEATIQPKSLEDVEAMLNNAWIPTVVIEAFFNAEVDAHRLEYGEQTWVKNFNLRFENGAYIVSGGIHNRANLMDKYLNRNGLRQDDKPTIDALNRGFKEWLNASPFRQQVEDLYNRAYTGFVKQKFSDAAMEVPGLNPDFNVNSYHWSGLRWALSAGKGIIAADVGLGKTGRALILNKLLRAHGLAKKPAIVVPKSVLANWAAEINNWFPGSRTLVIGESYATGKDGQVKVKTDDQETRNQKLHDLAQNDYDFALISQPVWNELDVNPITKGEYVQSDFWTQRAESLDKATDKRKAKIKEAYDQAVASRDFQKRSEVINFDDLGIDALILDEGHHFKNLYAARSRWGGAPKFLGGTGLSSRALDTQFKARWVREHNGGKNVFMLTATPTKNSPLEIYSMLAHVAPEAFEKLGIRNSEEFLDRFCEFTNDMVLGVDGTIEEGLITSGFKNLDELREVMKRYIDRTTAADVGLKLPARDEREHLVDMTPAQEAEYVKLRRQASGGQDTDGNDVHIFSIMDQMGKAALDLELLDEGRYLGQPSPKYDAVAAAVAEGAKEGGQVVFVEPVATHEKMRKALLAKGFKPSEIGIINATAAKSSDARQKIADAFNAGKIKVVIGNATMEEGINLQKQTTDIHHMDLPWEPATMQQRNGRGLRQGNLRESVRLHRYIAKGSFDGYRYQTISAKKDWQDQLWNGGKRLENLNLASLPSREEMMVMLAADPEQARVAYEKNRTAAMEALNAGKRADAGREFIRFREMSRSLSKLKDAGSRAATRLRSTAADLRTRLQADPHFAAKDALSDPSAVAVDPQTGRAFRPKTAVLVRVANKQPFNWADGQHKFVIRHVAPGNGEPDMVHLTPYGGTQGETLRIEAAKLAKHSEDVPYDNEAENAARAVQSLDLSAAALQGLGFDHDEADPIAAALPGAFAQAVAGKNNWHTSAEGRMAVWHAIGQAAREVVPTAKPHSVQRLMDHGELSMLLGAHGRSVEQINTPAALKDLPEAVITSNEDLLQRHLKSLVLTYNDREQGDYTLIDEAGKAKIAKSYEARGELDTHRLALPTAQDRKRVTDLWKDGQRARTFDVRRETPRGRHHSNLRDLAGVKVEYGRRFSGDAANRASGPMERLFGVAAISQARQELQQESQAAAALAKTFADRLAALLPQVEFGYDGIGNWKAEHIQALTDAADAEGLLRKRFVPPANTSMPINVFDAGGNHEGRNSWDASLGAALRKQANKLKDAALMERLKDMPWRADDADQRRY